jgi:hypothetical protein
LSCHRDCASVSARPPFAAISNSCGDGG